MAQIYFSSRSCVVVSFKYRVALWSCLYNEWRSVQFCLGFYTDRSEFHDFQLRFAFIIGREIINITISMFREEIKNEIIFSNFN